MRQEDVERERKPHDKDHENYQDFDKSVQDIMENCDVFSNPRKLPRQISSMQCLSTSTEGRAEKKS